MATSEVKQLKQIIDNSNNIVLFTGAGISVPSGIPDFRSPKGLYNGGVTKYGVLPEQAISNTFYRSFPKEFFEFYRENLVFKDAKPNIAHKYFAQLEQQGKIKAVVTQNIDGLHEMAGSKNVFNIHGTVYKNYCEDCDKKFDLDYVMSAKGVPTCDKCGGVVRPDVTLYEEFLNQEVVNGATDAMNNADTLIVVGTSLTVEPAASFVQNYFRGDNLVLINLQKTPYDDFANLIINQPIERVVAQLLELEQNLQKQ